MEKCREFLFVLTSCLDDDQFFFINIDFAFSDIVGLDVVDALDALSKSLFEYSGDEALEVSSIIWIGHHQYDWF